MSHPCKQFFGEKSPGAAGIRLGAPEKQSQRWSPICGFGTVQDQTSSHTTAAGSGLIDKKFSCRHVSDEPGMLFHLKKKRPWSWLEKCTLQKFDEYQSRNIRLLPPVHQITPRASCHQQVIWFWLTQTASSPCWCGQHVSYHGFEDYGQLFSLSNHLCYTSCKRSSSNLFATWTPFNKSLLPPVAKPLAATAAKLPPKESVTAITNLVPALLSCLLSTYKTGLALRSQTNLLSLAHCSTQPLSGQQSSSRAYAPPSAASSHFSGSTGLRRGRICTGQHPPIHPLALQNVPKP